MKKFIITLLMLMLCVSTALFTASCSEDQESSSAPESIVESNTESVIESESETESEIVDEQSFIEFKTLTVDGLTVYGKVSNETTTFSFINEIRTDKNCKYEVSLDIYGVQLVISKTIALNVGDNVVYVIEFKNDEPINLYTVTIRRRPLYRVTFNTDGGSAVATQYVEEDFLATQPTTEKVGYDFVFWNYNFNEPITRDTAIVASWSAHTDTKYTVNYYLQNLDDDEYTLHETVELTGTTDTTATAEIKGYPHFTYNASKSTVSGNINGDGSQVLSVYYTRDSYTISTTRNNAKAGTITSGGTYRFDKQITLIATTNAGHIWLGWYDGETLACETEEFTFKAEKDVTYTATWSANTDTKYTVNYYLQNLDDNNYTLHETVELKGETDTTATAEIKGYPHFTYDASKSTVSGNINGDGSRILSVYYTRDRYNIIANANNTKAGTSTNINGAYKFGKEVALTATTNAGYTWLGWYDGETCVCETEDFTFNVEKYVTYTAKWSAHTDTKYTANYYLQNLDDDEYTLRETVELTGTTDTTATAEIKTFEHFTYNRNKSTVSGNINGDGSRILSVYYTRNTYTLSINNSSFGSITNAGNYKYGTAITTKATPHLGYTFGWYSGEELLSTDDTYTFTVDKDVIAKFEIKPEMSKFNFMSTATTFLITGLKNKTVTEIIVPDYVTSIGEEAFRDCDSLTSVVIGDGVTSIGDRAFCGCFKLVEVVNKSTHFTVTKGSTDYGYLGCYALAVYNSGSGITESQLLNDNGYIIYTDGAEKILVGYNGVETDLVLPSYITEINRYAFSNCDSLTSVEIPDSVISIGDYAFQYCDSLTSVVIPDSVTSIDDRAFECCFKLVEVINKSTHFTVTKGSENYGYLGYYALAVYNSGSGITESQLLNDNGYIIYTDGAEKILVGYNGAETDLVLPSYITKIYQYAFYDCDSLTSITIPDSVTSIGDYAFRYCFKLVEVVNKSTHFTVTKGSENYGYLGYYALAVYNSGSGITESQLLNDNGYIIYTDGAEKILVGYNGAETDLVLPSYITKINRYAFYDCNSLTSVVIGNGVTSIGDRAFYSCRSLTSVVIGDGVTSIGDYAFHYCDSLTSIVIGDGVTSIGNRAFRDCDSLTSVVIPDNVTTIGEEAFSGCGGLTSVVIGDGVTSIGDYAFYDCDSLTSVVIGDSVTSIGYMAFYDCDSLTSVVIPDSVTSIGDWAFYECRSLTSVVIGNGVTSIGDGAFLSCDSLTSVYYKGTASEWSGISIGSANTYLTNATRYYYSEAEPTASGNYWHYDEDGNVAHW